MRKLVEEFLKGLKNESISSDDASHLANSCKFINATGTLPKKVFILNICQSNNYNEQRIFKIK